MLEETRTNLREPILQTEFASIGGRHAGEGSVLRRNGGTLVLPRKRGNECRSLV